MRRDLAVCARSSAFVRRDDVFVVRLAAWLLLLSLINVRKHRTRDCLARKCYFLCFLLLDSSSCRRRRRRSAYDGTVNGTTEARSIDTFGEVTQTVKCTPRRPRTAISQMSSATTSSNLKGNTFRQMVMNFADVAIVILSQRLSFSMSSSAPSRAATLNSNRSSPGLSCESVSK